MNVVEDSVGDVPIRIVVKAPSVSIPEGASWLDRFRGVNSHLRGSKASHLLRIVEGGYETWYAGDAGVSIAAGLEIMARQDESLAECVVVFPLDERVYWAELRRGSVVDEGAPFPNLLSELTSRWKSTGLSIVNLENGGKVKDSLDIEYARTIRLGMGEGALTYSHSFLLTLQNGMFRMTDATILAGFVVAGLGAFFVNDWMFGADELPDGLEPLQFVAPKPKVPPLRMAAPLELESMTAAVAAIDRIPWRVFDARTLKFDPVRMTLTLSGEYSLRMRSTLTSYAHAVDGELVYDDYARWMIAWDIDRIKRDLAPARLVSFDDLLTGLMTRLESITTNATYGAPRRLPTEEVETEVRVTLEGSDVFGLVRLVEVLPERQVQLDQFECRVSGHALEDCQGMFTIRGGAL